MPHLRQKVVASQSHSYLHRLIEKKLSHKSLEVSHLHLVVVVLLWLLEVEQDQVEALQDQQVPVFKNSLGPFHKAKLLNASNGLNCLKRK